jgi:hypothetical protein
MARKPSKSRRKGKVSSGSRPSAKRPARAKSRKASKPAGKVAAKPKSDTTRDPLDDFVTAAALALDLPVEPQWRAAIKTNLQITLRLGKLVGDFALPDDAEPAPVYDA